MQRGDAHVADNLQHANGEHRAQQGLQNALGDKRSADKAVRSAHKAHDGDLATTRGDREANRVVDKDEGDKREERHDHDSGDANVVSHLEQTANLLPTIQNACLDISVFIVYAGVFVLNDLAEARALLDLCGGGGNLRRVFHLDHKGARQRVLAVERRHSGIGVVGYLALVVGKGIFFGLEGYVLDVIPALELGLECLDIIVGGVVGNKRVDGNFLLHRTDRGIDHRGTDDEQADDEQRQEDGDDRTQRRSPVAEEVPIGLLDGITQIARRHSCRNLPSPGRE